uniref:hyaluronoglucosaminidase n=1 Tax=Nothobranchius rachovii TaxID=451742 RepID=A0A1A8QAJ6_9TELE
MAVFFLPISIISSIISVLALPPTEPPLIHGHPFVAIWNAPTDQCKKLEIPLDTAAFQAVTTPTPVTDGSCQHCWGVSSSGSFWGCDVGRYQGLQQQGCLPVPV